MKLSALLVVVPFFIAGCSCNISIELINQATQKCAGHGGLVYMQFDPLIPLAARANCKNGAMFIVVDKK